MKETDEGAKLYVAPTDDYFNTRVEGYINANIVRVEEIIRDLDARKIYNPSFKNGKIISEPKKDLSFVTMTFTI